MSGRTAKRIRRATGFAEQPDQQALRLFYKHAKREYSKLPAAHKAEASKFLRGVYR